MLGFLRRKQIWVSGETEYSTINRYVLLGTNVNRGFDGGVRAVFAYIDELYWFQLSNTGNHDDAIVAGHVLTLSSIAPPPKQKKRFLLVVTVKNVRNT